MNIKTHPLCPLCNTRIYRCYLVRHLIEKHLMTAAEATLFAEKNINRKFDYTILTDAAVEDLFWSVNNKDTPLHKIKWYRSEFTHFYKLLTYIRPYDKERDIPLFLNIILPWKKDHPCQGNNRELTRLMFKDDPESELKCYTKFMLEKNPYYKHDGTISVFSRKYKGYIGLSEDEITEQIKSITQYDRDDRSPTQLGYWLAKGYSNEEACKKLAERQNTFSLDICIKKYGEEEGTRRFIERQKKWQNTLKSKSIEEQQDINRRKVYKQGCVSKIESEFLHAILPDEIYHNIYIKNIGIGDLIYNNKLIEFYGDYWHCNPIDPRFTDGTTFHPYLKCTAAEKWEFDKKRVNAFIEAGFEVKIVWETDYKNNKNRIIQECKEFLGI